MIDEYITLDEIFKPMQLFRYAKNDTGAGTITGVRSTRRNYANSGFGGGGGYSPLTDLALGKIDPIPLKTFDPLGIPDLVSKLMPRIPDIWDNRSTYDNLHSWERPRDNSKWF